MSSFYLDHDVSRHLATALRASSHSVVTTFELGAERQPDGEQLLIAATNRWILLTHNRADFELLHDAWLRWSAAWDITPTHAGILVLPQGRPPIMISSHINALVDDRDPSNELHILLRNGQWKRQD